jgi:hypothetical protein
MHTPRVAECLIRDDRVVREEHQERRKEGIISRCNGGGDS